MILQRLVEFAERIPDACPPMYERLEFKWQVKLDSEGRYAGTVPLSDGSRGLRLAVPNRKRSGTRAAPILLADKVECVLGYGDESPGDSRKFREFRDLVCRCQDHTGDPAVAAVCRFLDEYAQKPFVLDERIKVGDRICFSVNDVRPTDIKVVSRFWLAETMADAKQETPMVMQCLICEQHGPVDRIAPLSIKRLGKMVDPKNGKAEVQLVSADKGGDAFHSFGKMQGYVAPTCRACGLAYIKSINFMLEAEQHHISAGPLVYLFWTRGDLEFNVRALLSQPTEEDVRALVGSYRTGRDMPYIQAEAFYALALSASGSRGVVRDWLETTVGHVQANLARWFRIQRLSDAVDSPGRYYGVYALTASLYPRKAGKPANLTDEKSSAGVARSLMRCALHGNPIPSSVLAQAIGRNRAEQGVTRNRAALIKAVLLSQMNDYKEDYMEKLDMTSTSQGYLCGRLLAELEAAQKAAINPKATIVDRYYGAASSAPATVFGNLMRGSRAHMSTLNRDKRGAFIKIDKNIQEILSGLQEFPKTLNLKEQAMFALGYYHQKAARWAKSEVTETTDIEEAE